jgi:hypothetical protein
LLRILLLFLFRDKNLNLELIVNNDESNSTIIINCNLLSIEMMMVTTITTTTVFAQETSSSSLSSTTSLDLTAPTVTDLSGGEKKGTLDLKNVQNGTIIATATMNEPPAEGQVYEGWFEDKGDATGYSLSIGKFNEKDNTLFINQTMVNPYSYTVFFVTAEPIDDPDLNPSDVVVSTKLPPPFGQ